MPNIKRYVVTVESFVTIDIDLDQFTEDIRRGYTEVIRPVEDLDEHIANIATHVLQAPGHEFIEGYGRMSEIGVIQTDVDVPEILDVSLSRLQP